MCYNVAVIGGKYFCLGDFILEKIAFIEINNFVAKLIIAEVKTNAYYNTIVKRMAPVELGKEFDKDHFFKRPQIDSAINILKQFKQICNVYGIERTYMIGTFLPDMRPRNLNSFVDEVYTKCGFKLETMDEAEQNDCIYRATLNTTDPNKAFAAEIGLDSVRLVHYNRRGVVNGASFPFGPLTLLSMFNKEEFPEEKARIDAINEYIKEEFKRIDWINDVKALKFIGIGGYFNDLAKMVIKYKKYPFDRTQNYEMDIEDTTYVIDQVLQMGLDESKKLKGLEDGRVDVFAVSLMIMRNLFDLLGTTKVTVSKNGVIEGKLLEKIIVTTQEKPILDMLEFGVSGACLGLRPEQQAHSKQVAALAGIIFRELKVVHKLPKAYLKVLKVAGSLHDIGYLVNYFNHSKHSQYAILNKEILGLTHREQILASFVASLHHGESLDIPLWIKYQSLFTEDDELAVKKLGVILNLAESFDVSMSNAITDIHCDILGDSVIFKTESEVDKNYELEEARKIGKQFENLFKKRLEIL